MIRFQIFPDVAKGSWYEKEVNDLFLKGIIKGNKNGKFYPGNTITRAEAVAMIGRAINLPGEKSNTAFQMFPMIILLLVISTVQRGRESFWVSGDHRLDRASRFLEVR